MAGGNPNKVNAIVDEIVKNNNSFKLKSLVEQDKEKDSIAQSINSAISVLNDVGKELVLQELSVDPDEKFKGFIDSVGNIDILGVTKITATIVKAKIEEAEREGIDLRRDAPYVLKNDKRYIVENILTVAVVDKMVNNFRNLSNEDRKIIIRNWSNLSKPQQAKVAKDYADMLHQDSLKATNEKDQSTLEEASKTNKEIYEWIADGKEMSEEDAITFWGDVNINEIQNSPDFMGFTDFLARQNPKMTLEDVFKDKKILANKVIEFFNEQHIQASDEMHAAMEKEGKLTEQVVERMQKSQDRVRRYGMKVVKNPKSLTSESKTQKKPDKTKIRRLSSDLPSVKNRITKKVAFSDVSNVLDSQKTNLNMKLLQEIEQIPSALAKANFSQEEIKENLSTYINFLSRIDDDEIKELSTWKNDRLCQFFNKKLIKFGMEQSIAGLLSKVNFNGQLFNILGNEEQKKEFFEQFDKAINQEHIQERDAQLDGELGEIVSQYFQDNAVDMNVSAIEAQKEQANTEQTKQSMLEEQPKAPKLSEQFYPVEETKIIPEEHTQETVTSPEHEISEETSQNMAMVEQDNSFIGKIKRVFANMRDMKNKDNSKGFFARLGASIQAVFGKKDEYSENQDKAKEQINNGNSSKTEQPISFDEQLRQGIDQNKFNHLNIPKGTIKEEKDSLSRDDDYEQK
ncbi:MAG TPA: hypothetical protein IAD08_05880 [Candidatus Scatovivens faecipullorum]|nr:hypothetical protein [Candidatus Scatovivens faecipullorum]